MPTKESVTKIILAKSTKPSFKIWLLSDSEYPFSVWYEFEYKLADGRKRYASETNLSRAIQHIVESFESNDLR
jgi:hypothetical protein